METPEKIYVHEVSASELTEELPYHIEYTRTDAFIDKVHDWLIDNTHEYWDGSNSVVIFEWGKKQGEILDDFRKAMEG